MTIAENISLDDLYIHWLGSKPFKILGKEFCVLKTDGAYKEYRLRRNGKEGVVLQYPQTKLGFCIITELIK